MYQVLQFWHTITQVYRTLAMTVKSFSIALVSHLRYNVYSNVVSVSVTGVYLP